MEVYRIKPAKVWGIIRSGPPKRDRPDPEYEPGFIGLNASWEPRFAENLPKDRWGYADFDGTVSIGPDAFEYPGKLAFALHHESRHFEEFLTPGLDLRNIPDWEVRHRERQRPWLQEVFDLKPKDVEEFDQKLARERERAAKWDELIRQGFDPFKKAYKPAFPGDYRRRWLEQEDYEQIEAILKQADTIRVQAREEAEKRRHLERLWLMSGGVCSGHTVGEGAAEGLGSRAPAFYQAEIDRARSGEYAQAEPCALSVCISVLEKLRDGRKPQSSWFHQARTLYSQELAREWAARRFKRMLDVFGFRFEGQGPWGLHFQDIGDPNDGFYLRSRYLDEAHAALFLYRTCASGEVAEPAAEPLEILAREAPRGGVPGWFGVIHGFQAQRCLSLVFKDPDAIRSRAGLEKVLAAHAERMEQERRRSVEESKAWARARRAEEKRKQRLARDRERPERETDGWRPPKSHHVPTLEEILSRL